MALDERSTRKGRRQAIAAIADRPNDRSATRLPLRATIVPDPDAFGRTDGDELAFTRHAEYRMVQRNLTRPEIAYIVTQGTHFHCAGAVIVYLRRKDVDLHYSPTQRVDRLVGATVVLDPRHLTVVTVYRNQTQGLRRIKRKPRGSRVPIPRLFRPAGAGWVN